MNDCVHLKKRKKGPYCKELDRTIDLKECYCCQFKEYRTKTTKSIVNNENVVKTPKKRLKRKYNKVERYSILTEDLTKCIECGRRGVQLHEIFFGISNRKKSIEDGLVIPLCTELHHNGNVIGIHQDSKLNRKWRMVAILKWKEKYKKTDEDFIERYGKLVIEEE